MTALQKVRRLIGWASAWLVAMAVLMAPLVFVQTRVNIASGRGAWASEQHIPHILHGVAVRYSQQLSREATVIMNAFRSGRSGHRHFAASERSCDVLSTLSQSSGRACGSSVAMVAPLVSPKMQDTAEPVSEVQTLQVSSTPLITDTIQPAANASVAERMALPSFTALSSRADCSKGTILTVVAHEDDDLLFMNPDLLHAATQGKCLRTVYITAGDSGQSETYWLNREDGAKASYAKMFNQPDNWQDTQVQLGDRMVETSSLNGVPGLGLVFLRLPDGNIHGHGFSSTGRQSLAHLWDGSLLSMQTVDGGTTYTKEQLTATLLAVMRIDTPDSIHTQGLALTANGDHSDHLAVGHFTKLAATEYDKLNIVTQYGGYPERLLNPNVAATDISVKKQLFFTYAPYDGAVCQNEEECAATTSYSNYLTREYEANVPLAVSATASTTP